MCGCEWYHPKTRTVLSSLFDSWSAIVVALHNCSGEISTLSGCLSLLWSITHEMTWDMASSSFTCVKIEILYTTRPKRPRIEITSPINSPITSSFSVVNACCKHIAYTSADNITFLRHFIVDTFDFGFQIIASITRRGNWRLLSKSDEIIKRVYQPLHMVT